jgi:YVTN family beta-propeller protein
MGLVLFPAPSWAAEPAPPVEESESHELDRSPVDLVLTSDERFLLTANQTSDSVSLVDVESGRLLTEVPCGDRPGALVLTPDERRVLVTASYGGSLHVYRFEDGQLSVEGQIPLGFEPRGIAVSPDGKTAYVALMTADAVAKIDLNTRTVVGRIPVGRWPRSLAISPDGHRLAVGTSGDGSVSVVDLESDTLLFDDRFGGLNAGQMVVSSDGRHVYFPFVVYGGNPLTDSNIRRGWVLASRVGRLRLNEKTRREAIAMDTQGRAVSDPHGLALTPDGGKIVVSASGTHELLVFRLGDLPFQDYGGPGDHIDPAVLADKDRFHRIEVGGRPMALQVSRDGRHVFVANYLLNCVQVVDLQARSLERSLALGGPEKHSLARDGEAIFLDGQRSLDQWYSCHTCHYEGGSNSVTMDTNNDDSYFSFKTVPALFHVRRTGPWTWHGWQKDLSAAMHKSLTDTLQGEAPSDYDVRALLAYFDSLQPPPNPHRGAVVSTGPETSQSNNSAADDLPDNAPGSEAKRQRPSDDNPRLSAAALRGRAVFRSQDAGCANCHSGPYLTDGEIHDVGLGAHSDRFEGFNTPSLRGIYRKVRYLHDGRSETLDHLLTGPHAVEKVSGGTPLSEPQRRDLIEYLKTL